MATSQVACRSQGGSVSGPRQLEHDYHGQDRLQTLWQTIEAVVPLPLGIAAARWSSSGRRLAGRAVRCRAQGDCAMRAVLRAHRDASNWDNPRSTSLLRRLQTRGADPPALPVHKRRDGLSCLTGCRRRCPDWPPPAPSRTAATPHLAPHVKMFFALDKQP